MLTKLGKLSTKTFSGGWATAGVSTFAEFTDQNQFKYKLNFRYFDAYAASLCVALFSANLNPFVLPPMVTPAQHHNIAQIGSCFNINFSGRRSCFALCNYSPLWVLLPILFWQTLAAWLYSEYYVSLRTLQTNLDRNFIVPRSIESDKFISRTSPVGIGIENSAALEDFNQR